MYVTQIEEKRRAKFVGKNYRKEENKKEKKKRRTTLPTFTLSLAIPPNRSHTHDKYNKSMLLINDDDISSSLLATGYIRFPSSIPSIIFAHPPPPFFSFSF